MAEVVKGTLYVLSSGSYLHRDHEAIRVAVGKEEKLCVPVHLLESIAVFGQGLVSPAVLELCAQMNVPVTFLTENGRLVAHLSCGSGSVLLRRDQYRVADDPRQSARVAKGMILGKIANARRLLLRAKREARDHLSQDDSERLSRAIDALAHRIGELRHDVSLETLRGQEGNAARSYFAALECALKSPYRAAWGFPGRSKRPARDRFNAVLSFVYALLRHDCHAALVSAGLDPQVGFLHRDRPGRPSLALDLMEEFRPLIADRFILTIINRKEIDEKAVECSESGIPQICTDMRVTLVKAYQKRKRDRLKHPFLKHQATVGKLPFLQARLLARYLRGDLDEYPPCVLR